ncbi:MAG: FMN-dependent NADH-azoreductase [Woeseiaceae bacterium]
MAIKQDERLQVLRIDSSGQLAGSSTRALLDELIAALQDRYRNVTVRNRDLARGISHVDDDWIAANLTPAGERSPAQAAKLAFSDTLVDELRSADVIVVGVPVYNFGIPAALKAWVDMVARARLTFRYSEQGPVGLLQGKKVYLVVASGGVAVDSDSDFATPYMRHALRFLGIEDIEVIAADQQIKRGHDAMNSARTRIADIVQCAASSIAGPRVA